MKLVLAAYQKTLKKQKIYTNVLQTVGFLRHVKPFAA